jgi:hypothetical protein
MTQRQILLERKYAKPTVTLRMPEEWKKRQERFAEFLRLSPDGTWKQFEEQEKAR